MRILLSSLALVGLACFSGANAAHISVTAMGNTFDIECSEITVNGTFQGENWLGTTVCEKVCDQVDAIDGWGCEFHGEYLIIDGPAGSDLAELFKSGELELDLESTTKSVPTAQPVSQPSR